MSSSRLLFSMLMIGGVLLAGCSSPKSRLQREWPLVQAEMQKAGTQGTLRVHEIEQVHKENVIIEMQCPDRMRLNFTGPTQLEEILIGKDVYFRSRNQVWRKIPNPYPTFLGMDCAQIADYYSKIFLSEPYTQYDVRDLGASASHDIPCHKWRLIPPHIPGDLGGDAEVCISDAHQVLKYDFERSGVLELYDFGAPIQIELPESWVN